MPRPFRPAGRDDQRVQKDVRLGRPVARPGVRREAEHRVSSQPDGAISGNGTTTYHLRSQYNAVDLVSNGSNWFVTAKL
jgi:hypothetical protein